MAKIKMNLSRLSEQRKRAARNTVEQIPRQLQSASHGVSMTDASRSPPSSIATPPMSNETRSTPFEQIDAAFLGVAEALPRLP
ncbi:MAG TPA: hypothetical protein VJ783_01555 [Pirellulales bacterium]|nr:hypothetical protein [Pirellulales bacterium]